MTSRSIFELINLVIRKIDSVRFYQGEETRQAATIEHIASGLVFSLIVGILSIWSPYLMFLNIPVWGFYAVFKELVLDKKKNAGQPNYVVTAQIIERSVGFVFGLIINVIFCMIRGI